MLTKAEVKKDILTGLADEAEDRVRGLHDDLRRFEGARSGLEQARVAIERDVFARLRRDLEEGKVDAETQAPVIDRYVRLCIHFLQHMIKQADTQIPIQQGRVDEARNMIKMLRSSATEEQKKLEARAAAVESGTAVPTPEGDLAVAPSSEHVRPSRPEGVHPGISLKAQRLAQEAAEEVSPSVPEDTSIPPSTISDATASVPEKKKRRYYPKRS